MLNAVEMSQSHWVSATCILNVVLTLGFHASLAPIKWSSFENVPMYDCSIRGQSVTLVRTGLVPYTFWRWYGTTNTKDEARCGNRLRFKIQQWLIRVKKMYHKGRSVCVAEDVVSITQTLRGQGRFLGWCPQINNRNRITVWKYLRAKTRWPYYLNQKSQLLWRSQRRVLRMPLILYAQAWAWSPCL